MEPKRPDPNASIESLCPARFLRPYHLIDNGMTQVSDIIKDILIETVEPRGKPEEKPVLYFGRINTPYLLSAKGDIDTLRIAYGAARIGDLVGMTITIYVSSYKGRAVLRIKPTRPAQETAAGTEDEE
ncbi:MAG: hypothetical protein GY753_16960 [Gammaproteobacteria bacterium]|nr:hypothetical protein [Gammaproteobacteria bacterium]